MGAKSPRAGPVRNSLGNILWAISDFYGFGTNMMAETRALLEGLNKCKGDGRSAIDIEADSLILFKILKCQLKVPWAISYEI